jgi:hypothetical protein
MNRRRGAVVLIAVLAVVGAAACKPKPLPEAPSCPMMPADNYWHAKVDALPVHPRSAAWVAAIGLGEDVHADFGSGLWDGGPIGIPYVTVGGDQPDVDITFDYDDESDPGPYPIPADAPIEGGPDADGDRHILVVDRDNCILSEVFYAWPQPDGSWEAGSGAVFDLRSNDLRPAGWTSADAAGLPILPGLVRYDEVAAGRIMHALRFTAPVTQRAYVWPARHFASTNTSPDVPPMGAWFRLKASVDPNDFSAQARPIVVAMKTYGIILADNGSPWYVSGVPDERWDNDALHELDVLTGADFEAVDTSSLIVDPDSGQFQQS